ncbi:hypothetical protein Dimus_031269 [Dionaea muscipula]
MKLMMGCKKQAALLAFLFFSFFFMVSTWHFTMCLAEEKDVVVTIRTVTSIARTDDNFICATLDWWPPQKCDYGQCPWGKAGIIKLDLNKKILKNAVKAFDPLRIRIGGSLQDQVIYKVGKAYKKCTHFRKQKDGRFGFSEGCLKMERWDQLNNFFNETGAMVTFGLNAVFGRIQLQGEDEFVGDWNVQNSKDLMDYTISKGYNTIESYEFGNELCGGGVSGRVSAEQYAKDMIALKNMVKELYPDPATQPKVLGPSGFYDKKWFNDFLLASGPHVVDGLTHHVYNLGPGVDKEIIYKIQDPFYLDQIAQTYNDIEVTINKFGPWAPAWIGEAGGAWNSGSRGVQNTFVDGFWYLDQLGMTSTFNHKVFCRQALIGGNYALLNTTTFIPNPDYYGALLWHRLMGKNVLSTIQNDSPYLRAYSHCSRNKPGVTVLLINMSNSTTFKLSLVNDFNLHPPTNTTVQTQAKNKREEYLLTPQDGNIQSDVVLLNGEPLKLTKKNGIPEMNPKLADPSSPIVLMPHSILFATIRDFQAPACA